MTDNITQNISVHILFVSVIQLKALLHYHIFAESIRMFHHIIRQQIRTKMYIHLSGLSSYHKISDANPQVSNLGANYKTFYSCEERNS
jgi:hypothetical protein